MLAVGLGLLIALPLALLSMRYRRSYGPTLAITGVLYTIPSLALFAMLVPVTGFLSRTTALIPLAAYTLLILVRNTVTGLDGVAARGEGSRDGHGLLRGRGSCCASSCRSRCPRSSPASASPPSPPSASSPSPRSSARVASGALMLDGFQRDFRRRSPSASCCRSRSRSSPTCCLLGALTPGDAVAQRKSDAALMGFLGDVVVVPDRRRDTGSGDEGIPTLFRQHLQLTLVSVAVRRAASRCRSASSLGHLRQGGGDRGQHRQRRPRAPRARAAHPRGAVGRHRRARPASLDARAVDARVHRDGRARGAADARERVRRGGRRRRRDPRSRRAAWA